MIVEMIWVVVAMVFVIDNVIFHYYGNDFT